MPDKNNPAKKTAQKAGLLTVASAQKAMPGMFPAAALGKMAASRAFSPKEDSGGGIGGQVRGVTESLRERPVKGQFEQRHYVNNVLGDAAQQHADDPGRMTDKKMKSLNDAIDSRGSEIDAVADMQKKKKKKRTRLKPMEIKGTVK